MKGVYPTLSHSLLLLLGLLSLGLIVVSVSASLARTEKNLITLELNYVANSVEDKILEVYSLADSNYSTGKFRLDLPERIGNRKYSLTLTGNVLLVNMTVRGEPIEISRSLNIDAELNGSSFMPASISLERDGGITRIGLVE
jgi:hypothetical protein